MYSAYVTSPEEQGSVALVGNEHRGRYSRTGPDAVSDTELLVVLVATMTLVADVVVRLNTLVLHVLSARLSGVLGMGGSQDASEFVPTR